MKRSPRQLVILVAAAVATATLPASGPAGADANADTAPAELTHGWQIRSSAGLRDSGAAISQPGYSAGGWLPISQPETLMAALLENGRYPNIFRSANLAAVPTDQFAVNWWYREEIVLHPKPGQHSFLVMNGVLSRANLWVNGTKLADQSQLQGAYS